MDKIKESILYKEDIQSILKQKCNWNVLKNKTLLITGATGLIGSPLVDMLILLNEKYKLELRIFIITRQNIKSKYSFIKYIVHDISNSFDISDKIDYIIHAASNTHPLQYSQFPIKTIETNIFGTKNLLNIVTKNPNCRFLLVSSVEVYGDDDKNLPNGFSEKDFGFLDCNNSRACYNESKRMSETICAAYASERKIDYVICRLCRSYGPTLKKDDSKALSQFLHNAINGQDIILKSEGNQYFSYIYSADAASAILFILLNGKSGDAYNISDEKSNITLKELANLIAEISNTKVIIDLPNEIEKNGFSKAQRAILNSKKLRDLGWFANNDIKAGLNKTIKLLKEEI